MTEPRTEAGRELLAQIRGRNPWQLGNNPVALSAFVFAIEEEARVDALNGAGATDFQHQLVQRNIDLTNEVLALREALTAYGDHRQPCEYGPGLRCTCGWLDKLRALMAKEPRP